MITFIFGCNGNDPKLFQNITQQNDEDNEIATLSTTGEMLSTVVHKKGCLVRTPIQVVFEGYRGATSVDLSSYGLRVGDQQYQDCVGWALAYAKTYQERREIYWCGGTNQGPPYNNHNFCPAFIYNEIKLNGGDNGSYVEDGLNYLQTNGCITRDLYNPTSIYTHPDDSCKKDGLRYKINSWGRLYTTAKIKDELAKQRVVVISVECYPEIENLSPTNDTYDNPSGVSADRHALCLVGYDDSKNAFRFINSWGTSWGVNGYAWISYDMITNSNVTRGAWSLKDEITPVRKCNSYFKPRDRDIVFLRDKSRNQWLIYSSSDPYLNLTLDENSGSLPSNILRKDRLLINVWPEGVSKSGFGVQWDTIPNPDRFQGFYERYPPYVNAGSSSISPNFELIYNNNNEWKIRKKGTTSKYFSTSSSNGHYYAYFGDSVSPWEIWRF